MQRILGQDEKGTWHVASVTYTTTMQTRCARWVKAVAFFVEEPEVISRRLDPEAPRCPPCHHSRPA